MTPIMIIGELSFLILGTGVEKFLEGYEIFFCFVLLGYQILFAKPNVGISHFKNTFIP